MYPARASLFSLEQIGIKLGLDQIRGLNRALGDPAGAFPSVIVAGTNGKGSVCAMVERGLRAAGLTTGRFTSPHLVHLEERFAVNGRSISAEEVDRLAERVLHAAGALPAPPSFFEATTAIALEAFRDAAVDVAVLEVGLGGRLDATNVVDAGLAVITMIDFDHQQYLGTTIEEIAREKAGVIKAGATVVLARNPPEVGAVVAAAAGRVGARLVHAWDGVECPVEMHDGHATITLTTGAHGFSPMRLALAGRHQVQNAVTAVRALEEYAASRQLPLGADAIATGLEDAEWPARLETRQAHGVTVLIDGAHNPAGARALASHILETYARRLPLVVGAMRDKDLDEIFRGLAPAASSFICTAPRSARAARPADLALIAKSVAPTLDIEAEDDPLVAVERAATRGTPVVVAGSLYLAGQVREEWS